MAHYYFHLREGRDLLPDEEGRQLPDADAARDYALFAARALISADVADGILPLHLHIEVEEHGGDLIHCLPFTDAVALIARDG